MGEGEDGEAGDAVVGEEGEFEGASSGEQGVDGGAVAAELGMGGARGEKTLGPAAGSGDGEDGGESVADEVGHKAGAVEGIGEGATGVAAVVAEEFVVSAPKGLKRGHGGEDTGSGGHRRGVFAQKGGIVGDVFKDIHEKQQIGIGGGGGAEESQGLAVDGLFVFGGVTGIDAGGGLCRGVLQQQTGEEAGAGTDIENGGWASVGRGVSDAAQEDAAFGAVVPMGTGVGAEEVEFLEVHVRIRADRRDRRLRGDRRGGL